MDAFPPPLFQEGLFLRPHHLQLEQRHRETMCAVERSFLHPNAFGMFAFEIDRDILRAPPQQRALSFRRLHAVMPLSGRVVMFDHDGGNLRLDPLPLPDSLGPYDGVLQVWLAVPRWSPGRPNTEEASSGANPEDPRLFTPLVQEVNDENSGRNRQPVAFRQNCGFLLMEKAGVTPKGDVELLPLVRLIDAPNEEQRGELIVDPAYSGPALLLSAQPEMLRQWDLFVRHAAGQRQVAENRVRPRFNIDGMTFGGWRQLQKLQILNTYVPRLRLIGQTPGASPWLAWMELAGMHGMLAGLYPEHLPWEEPGYDAMNPLSSLLGVMRRIRSFLDAELAPVFRELAFHSDGEGALRCVLDDRVRDADAAKRSEFFLAVKAEDVDRERLREEIADGRRFKIVAASDVGRAIFGIPLRYEAFPPEDMPQRRGMVVFRMDRGEKSGHLWEKAFREGVLAIPEVSRDNLVGDGGGRVELSLVVISAQTAGEHGL